MAYTREELDWVEAEWAYHLHGRQAFMSREDYLQLRKWEEGGVPSEAVVAAMEAYFERRARRAKPRTWVALAHLEKDVDKAAKLRAALARDEGPAAGGQAWGAVGEPLASDPRARAAFEAWKRCQDRAPAPDAPGFLEHFDEERRLQRDFLALAEERLGSRADALRAELKARLEEARIQEGTLVWKRAWDHHWSRTVFDAWGIP